MPWIKPTENLDTEEGIQKRVNYYYGKLLDEKLGSMEDIEGPINVNKYCDERAVEQAAILKDELKALYAKKPTPVLKQLVSDFMEEKNIDEIKATPLVAAILKHFVGKALSEYSSEVIDSSPNKGR